VAAGSVSKCGSGVALSDLAPGRAAHAAARGGRGAVAARDHHRGGRRGGRGGGGLRERAERAGERLGGYGARYKAGILTTIKACGHNEGRE
jgi:hypothetical protein